MSREEELSRALRERDPGAGTHLATRELQERPSLWWKQPNRFDQAEERAKLLGLE